MGDKTLTMTMLLDFYGELLTEKQRSCFNMHYNEDLSLSEIAEILNISRQGAHDLVLRAEATLTETEEKIGMVRRFSEQRVVFDSMADEIKELVLLTEGRAKQLSETLSEELERVKI